MRAGQGMSTEEASRAIRPGLALAATWRVIAELWRRHHRSHELRLRRQHPGISVLGQWCLTVHAEGQGSSEAPLTLVLNLGGPSGSYQVLRGGEQLAEGHYLWPILTGSPLAVVDEVERGLGLQCPTPLPPSTGSVLAVRAVAEVLAAASFDREGLDVEPAWFAWSGGDDVRPWACHFGHDVPELQRCIASGRPGTEGARELIWPWMRLARAVDGQAQAGEGTASGCLVDLKTGLVLISRGSAVDETLTLPAEYAQHGRRLEPVVARILAAVRSG